VSSIERFEAGEEAPPGSAQPGDVIFTHRSTPISRLIRLGQRWRFRRADDRPFAYWSHCAIVVDGAGSIVEAESTGVQRNPLSKYRDVEYHLVKLGRDFTADGRGRAAAYAEQQVGKAFGFLVMLSLSIWLLTGIRVRLRREDHQICSGLVAHALQEGGQLEDMDATFVLPADLARRMNVRPAGRGAAPAPSAEGRGS
jgi:uncharacterized protein YycO